MGGEAKPLRHHPALRRLGKRNLATLLGGVVALVVLAFAIARSSFAGDESYGDDDPAFGSFGSLRLGASDPARPRAERWLGDRAGSGAFASRMDRARSSIDALSLARDDDRAGGAGTQHPTPRGDRERRRGARDRDGPRGFPRAFEDDVPDDDDDDASGAAGTRDASDASSRARSSDVDHLGALALGGERLPTPLDLAPPSLSRRSTRVESSLDWMRSHLGGGGARADARPARPPPVIEPIDFDADDAKDSAAGDARLATPFRSSSSDLIHAASHHRASSSAPSSASSSSCARCGHRGACASPSTSSSSSSSACRCATAWEGRACRSPRSLGSHPPSFVASGYEVNGGAFALPELTLTRANAPDTLEVRLRRDDVAPARAGVVSASARARLPDVDPLEGRWFDSCAVVGGGGSLLGSGRGADIDAHAAVFRFGRAPTVGFERDAGSRTTHRVVDDASADFRESAGEVVLRIARSKRAFRDVFHQLALAKERAAAKTRGGVFARVSSYFGPYRPADDEENEGGGGAESSASSVSYALTPAFLAWLDDAFAFEPAPELVGVVVATLKCARVELFGFQMQSFDGVKDRYHEPDDDDGSVFENEIPSVVGYEARGGAGKSRGAEGSEGGFASGFGGLGGSDPSDADADASDADSNEPVAWPTKSAMDGNEFAVLKAMASRGFVGFAEPCVVRCHEGAKSCDACLAADAELAADDDAAGDAEGGSGGGASKRGVFGGPRFGGGARGIGDRVAGWMTEVGDALSHSLGERRGNGNGGDAAEFVEFWRRGGGARGQGVPGDRGEKKAGFGDEDGFEAFEDVNGDSYGEDPGLEDAEPTTRADETTLFERGAGDGGKVRESLTPRRAGGAFRGYE